MSLPDMFLSPVRALLSARAACGAPSCAFGVLMLPTRDGSNPSACPAARAQSAKTAHPGMYLAHALRPRPGVPHSLPTSRPIALTRPPGNT
jgi:hypothetical protein